MFSKVLFSLEISHFLANLRFLKINFVYCFYEKSIV